MTDMAANRASTSRSLPPPTLSTHSPVSLHAMSTRSSEALARRQSTQQQQQQQPPQPQQQLSAPTSSTSVSHQQHPESHGLPSIEGRLTRKRARSINVEQANYPRVDGLSLQSPGLAGTPPGSASTVSATDLICICPSPPKVPRPRNAFILYRQHHQAGIVLKYPGLANPEISKIIGEHWREEPEETKNSWKRLAEEEKARHQRQYPQYKYQPRRGGKNGPASRPSSGAGGANGEDPGRCPKCGGRYIATPRTPSTPFGSVSSQGGQFGPGAAGGPASGGVGGVSSAAMQPFITNNPRIIEAVPPHHQQYQHHQQPHHIHHRSSIDAQYHHGHAPEPRRPSYGGYPHPPEPLRPIEEDYEGVVPPSSRRRGPPHPPDDYEMLISLPDLKRRRFGGGPFDRSPERNLPMSAIPQHPGHPQQQQQQQQQQQAPPPHHHMSPMSSSPAPYPQHPGSRRSSLVGPGGGGGGPSPYAGQPGGTQQSGYPMSASLPHPRVAVGPSSGGGGGGGGSSAQRGPGTGGDMGGMAPPPRPSRLSTSSVPPPSTGGGGGTFGSGGGGASGSRGSAFDESLTLAPLQIPNSPTQNSERSLSSGGPSSGLGIMTTGGPTAAYSSAQKQRGGSADSQARGVEAMVMSIPYMNKLDVLRKISPPLGPPASGSPAVETRGPVIAIEGANPALMRAVRPVIERALRGSGECEVRLWMDSSVVDNGLSGLSTPPSREAGGGATARKRCSGILEGGGEDVEMGESQQQDKSGGGRHNSVGGSSSRSRSRSRSRSSNGGSSTPVPPPAARRGTTTEFGGGGNSAPTSMYSYLQKIMTWHDKSAEIVKHITTQPLVYFPTITSPETEGKSQPSRAATRATANNHNGSSSSRSSSSSSSSGRGTSSSTSRLLPVALMPSGFSLTLSDRFASTIAITDPYSPVDHWQWMATLWRGIVGADLVVYVRGSTPEEVSRNMGGGVEYRAPGIMVVRVATTMTTAGNGNSGGGGGGSSGDNNLNNTKIGEKTERRLAFEVMEWVRAGSFRDGYAFGGGGGVVGGGGFWGERESH